MSLQKVLTFGTFDVLHPGHISYLTQAQNLGEELHICVARDETVLKVKNRKPQQDEHTRMQTLREYFPDAKIHLGNSTNYMQILDTVKPSIIALGYDQKSFVAKIKPHIKKNSYITKIVRLKPFEQHIYKSSIFRTKPTQQKRRHGSLDDE